MRTGKFHARFIMYYAVENPTGETRKATWLGDLTQSCLVMVALETWLRPFLLHENGVLFK